MGLKYLYMGSPPLAATILEKLCEKFEPPSAVVTQVAKAAGRGNKVVPTAVEVVAREKGLNVIATENVNSPDTMAQLEALKPDLILVAAFGQIFREPLLRLPRLYCLNVHASLLPKYRGAAPIQWAIYNGDAENGISIQKMTKKLDAGDVLVKRSIPIAPDDTSADQLVKLADLGGECLVEAVRLVESGNPAFVAQDEAAATFAPKIERHHAPIDWQREAEEIRNQIRALQPWPIAETILGKDRLKVFRADVIDGKGKPPGEIATDSKTYLHVACGGGGALSLTEIQLENRKRLDIKSFLMAYRGSFPFSRMGALEGGV